LVGVVVLLLVLAVVAIVLFATAEYHSRRRDAKHTTRYAIVVEKIPPRYPLGPGALGEDISMPWVYPWEGMEPECYELALKVVFYLPFDMDDYDDDNEPPVDSVLFTVVVDKQTYESVAVGGRMENPYYDAKRANSVPWYDAVYQAN
jgi:hypothetical protein